MHPIIESREQLGEYHLLVKELRPDESRFHAYFRMDTSQFGHLLSLVGPAITKLNSDFRSPIYPAQKLAVCLRFLTTGDSVRSIASSYRLGHSTVACIVQETAQAIWNILAPTYLPAPKREDWIAIAQQFETRWGFPNCIGALDGKH